MEKKLLAVALFACMLGGCATTNNPAAADQPRDEGVLMTGSRLPQKSSGTAPVSGYSKEGWEDSTRGHKQVNPQGK